MTRIGWIALVSLVWFVAEVVLIVSDASGLNVLGAFLVWLVLIFNLVFGE